MTRISVLTAILVLALTASGARAQGPGKSEAPGTGPAVATTLPAQCPDNMAAYAGSGETLTCACPAEATRSGTVWGTDTYTADSATCRAALHAGMVGPQGGSVTVRMLPGEARYPGTTRNGLASSNHGAYSGSYRFHGGPAAAATTPVAAGQGGTPRPAQCPDNMAAYSGSEEVLSCACPAERMRGGTVWGTDVYTADSATCRAALHAGVLGLQGGPVTVRMLPGEPRYPGTTRNGFASSNHGAYTGSYRFDGVRPTAPSATAAPALSPVATGLQQCPDNMAAYSGSEEVLACTCPADRTRSGSVWGTDTYTADSATCRAAVHAGTIAVTGGPVTVRMLPGEARYPGTTRNGFASSNHGAYSGSYRFEGRAAAAPAAVVVPAPGPAPVASGPQQCPDDMASYAGSGETLQCLCPGEATLGGTVWGTDIYTADTRLCRAAVHAGAIPLTGGPVTVQMLPGQPRYPGTTRNGIASSNHGAYGASFRLSGPGGRAAAAPVQAPVAEAIRRTGQVQLYVTFRTGSADLDINAAPVLMQVRDTLAADPTLRLRLVGHTDSTGTAAINTPLSANRARSVAAWLMANGIAPDRLVTEGRGPTQPIADNASEGGRSLNRRVQALRLE